MSSNMLDARERHEKENKDHKLRLISNADKNEVDKICDLCYDYIDLFPFYYECDHYECRARGKGYFVLHKVCGDFKPLQIEAPSFHNEHTSIFDLRRPRDYSLPRFRSTDSPHCDYCFKFPRDYLKNIDFSAYLTTPYYYCKICNFMVCLECATTPRVAASGDGSELEHTTHQHLLKRYNSSVKFVKCTACDRAEILGGPPLYGCLDPICNFFLHASCAMIPELLYNHPLHPHPLRDNRSSRKCELWLDFFEYFTCNFCLSERYGSFGFSCYFCDKFNICWKCIATVKRNVFYENHKHPLYFVEKTADGDAKSLGRCSGYDTLCTRHEILSGNVDTVTFPCEFRHTECWTFRCMVCDFELHLLCGPLPSTIKHYCHIHDLALLDSLAEDDSGEYYCDVCETERDPRIRFYYCKDCKYSAHVHCVMSEISNVIRGDLEGVEIVPLGNWTIASKGKQEYRFIANTLMSTILDGELKDEEKQIVKKWYAWDHEGDNTRISTILDGELIDNKKQIVKKWIELDDEGDNTMVHIVQPSKLKPKSKFALMNYKEIMETLRLTSFTDYEFMEFCKDVEDYNKDQIFVLSFTELNFELFEVKGYMIPRSLIGVLVTLLDEHIDLIGADTCRSTSIAMKSFVLFILCRAVKRMRGTLVKDINRDLLCEWFHHLKFVTIQGFNIVFALVQWESLVDVFLGIQATRLEEEIPTKLKAKMAKLKEKIAQIEQGLQKCEKFCDLSQRSKYMKYYLKRVSESRWHNALEDRGGQISSVSQVRWKW